MTDCYEGHMLDAKPLLPPRLHMTLMAFMSRPPAHHHINAMHIKVLHIYVYVVIQNS